MNKKSDIFHWCYVNEKELTGRLGGLSIHHDIISVQRTWRMFWRCYLIVYREREEQ